MATVHHGSLTIYKRGQGLGFDHSKISLKDGLYGRVNLHGLIVLGDHIYRCSGQPRGGGITIICQEPDHHGVIVQYWMLIP